jgi:hypothetical protein
LSAPPAAIPFPERKNSAVCAGLPWPHSSCNQEEIRVFDHEDERFTGLLKQVYGIKVELPSGYNLEGGVRIKFFNFFMGIFF